MTECYRCIRAKSQPYQPPMAALPPSCVVFNKAFAIIYRRHRSAKLFKAYSCSFVCSSTNAIQLKIATDLSTEAFSVALRRFIARRGRSSQIHSNCSNFVGVFGLMNQYLREAIAGELIEWKFNSPGVFHFGGIWEAEMLIEALLNSRPLTSVNSGPKDLNVLNFCHFLTS